MAAEGLPHYWTVAHGAAEAESSYVRRRAQRLLRDSRCPRLGCSEMNSAEVVRVVRVEDVPRWRLFQSARGCAREQFARVGIPELEPPVNEALRAFRPASPAGSADLNDYYLFHGTKWANVELIRANGLSEKAADLSGLYGAGVYFAEEACKAHQYTDTNDAEERCILLCRVALCTPQYTTQAGGEKRRRQADPVDPALAPGLAHGCVVANSGKANAGNQQHREFVVFEATRCYLEYLVVYKVP